MTRRCQSCLRLFPGDVCPGCGMDHVIHVECTEEERMGVPTWNSPTGHRNAGVVRGRFCVTPGCGQEIPSGKGGRRYCFDCRPMARHEAQAKYLAAMPLEKRREMWRRIKAKRRQTVPRPVGGSQGPIGRTERPGSGRGTPHPKGAA